jgi:hypothetical protein
MMENVAVIPNARSIHTKKKASLELPISPPITPRVPLMWMTGTTSPRTDPKKMMMYPARCPGSSSVPHTTGRGYLYIKKLTDVDQKVLETLITKSVAARRAEQP